MDSREASLYNLIIGYGVLISFFSLIQIFSAAWLHRKFRQKRALRFQAVLLSRETERERISVALHDVTGPIIYRIRRNLEQVAKASENLPGVFDNIMKDVNLLDSENHALSNDLYPVHLEKLGLRANLSDLVSEWGRREQLIISLECANLPEFEKDCSIQIFRIVQEIILNTIKHAHASVLQISIHWLDDQLTLILNDNGIGFNTKKVLQENNRMGISNIYSYAASMKGTAQLDVSNGCQWHILLQPELLRTQ